MCWGVESDATFFFALEKAYSGVKKLWSSELLWSTKAPAQSSRFWEIWYIYLLVGIIIMYMTKPLHVPENNCADLRADCGAVGCKFQPTFHWIPAFNLEPDIAFNLPPLRNLFRTRTSARASTCKRAILFDLSRDRLGNCFASSHQHATAPFVSAERRSIYNNQACIT